MTSHRKQKRTEDVCLMMNNEKTVYHKILNLLKKHKDILVFDVNRLEWDANCHLFGLELVNKYGLELNPRNIKSLEFNRLSESTSIGWWGKEDKRTISWPDDGNQPDNELLLCIHFSTGAYFFDSDYPTKLFQQFVLELKSYMPAYIDTPNHSLYFSMDNASKIFNNYEDILSRYRKKNEEERKCRDIEHLKKQIEELEAQ